MRVLVTVALLLLLLEAILGFACFAGWYWLGGGLWGTVLVAAVTLLIIAPWFGELRLDIDSQEGRLAVVCGWWFALRATQDPREVRMRIIFLPLRFRPQPGARAKQKEKEPPEKPAAKRPARRPSAESIVRMIPPALQMLVDLLWEAREVSLRVQAPVQNSYADLGIAAVVGERHWGPLDLVTSGTGERAFSLRYRAGLLRAFLSMLYCAVQGRPWRLRPKRE